MRKIRFSRLVALALSGTLVFAATAPSKAAETTTLTIWTFGNVIQPALVLEYKRLNPNINFSIKKSELDPLNGQALVTACATAQSQNGPDIAAIEIAYSGYWRSYPQCFVNLKTMTSTTGNKTGNNIKKDYLSWRWANGVAYNGNVIGIPTDVGGLQVAYRTDLFKKAGLPTNRDAVSKLWGSWSSFIATGERYMKSLSAKDKKDKVAFIDSAGSIYSAMLNQGTEKYYRNNNTADGVLVYSTNPSVRNAFNTTVTAMQSGIDARTAQFSSDWNVGMTKGKFATILAPAWMLDYIKQQAPTTRGKWDVAAIPGGGGNQGGTQLSIPTSGKTANRQAAWDFISWYLAPEQQLKVFKTYGFFPSTTELYTDKELVNYKDPFFNNAPIGKIYSTGVKKLKPIFEGKRQRAIDQAFGNALARVAAKKQTPAKAWAQALKDIKTAVGG
jgi:cellobiose transport system substrate-binding protein